MIICAFPKRWIVVCEYDKLFLISWSEAFVSLELLLWLFSVITLRNVVGMPRRFGVSFRSHPQALFPLKNAVWHFNVKTENKSNETVELIWRCVYRASYCNVLMTNEMYNYYNQFLFHSFLSALHVSNESSRSSSGARHNILHYTVQSVQSCRRV